MLVHNLSMKNEKLIKVVLLLITFFCCIEKISSKESKKIESVKLKYELYEEVCEKEKCKVMSLSTETVVLDLEKESDDFSWKYKAVDFANDQLLYTIGLKVNHSLKPDDMHTLQVNLAVNNKKEKERISWGIGDLEYKVQPTDLSIIVTGKYFILKGKTITPYTKVTFVKDSN